MSDEEFRCSQCGAHKRCRGGESAHRDNWYCPQCERIERLKRELHDAHNEKVKAIGEFGLAVQRAEKAEADRDEYKMMFETTEKQLNRHLARRAEAEARAERLQRILDRVNHALTSFEEGTAAATARGILERAALAEEDDAGSDDRSA